MSYYLFLDYQDWRQYQLIKQIKGAYFPPMACSVASVHSFTI
jgi:hypothetical protein